MNKIPSSKSKKTFSVMPFFSLTFSEGKFLDLWTVPHLLFGFGMGLVLSIMGVTLWKGLLLVSALALLWEFFEYSTGIYEALENSVLDVLLAVLMAYLGYLFKDYFGGSVANGTLSIVVLLFVVITAIGWMAYTSG